VRFINEHKDHQVGPDGLCWGVESICAVLFALSRVIAPSTYYDARDRAPSRRALRDAELKAEITRVFKANYDLFGARKIWLILRTEDRGGPAAPSSGLCASWASKAPDEARPTTVDDEQHQRPTDLVDAGRR